MRSWPKWKSSSKAKTPSPCPSPKRVHAPPHDTHTPPHTTRTHHRTTRHAHTLASALERKRQTDRTEEEELKARVREHAKNLRAYWVPGKAPSAEESLLPKPSSKTHDPMSNDPVRLKDLLPIEFTPVQNVNVREADKIGRWMCPVCFTILSNRYRSPPHTPHTPHVPPSCTPAHACDLHPRY